jgi:chlorophyll(ide) b reductase
MLTVFTLAAAFVSPVRHSALGASARSHVSMADKPGVVITGGAAGVGWAYAVEFSERGYPVVICDIKDTSAAVAAIRQRVPNGAPVFGTQCDVSDSSSVEGLGEFAKEKLGTVGWWINNAGINGGRRPFVDVPIKAVEAVVKVNLLGVLYCTQVAIKLMHEQQGVQGHVFNTVGSGVKGGGTPGYVTYGATKRGLPQMTDSLVKELTIGVQGYERKPTKGVANCHTLSPGMVFTDLLLDDSTPELRKFPFGVLAAQPEEVAADIVPKILATSGQGANVEFLSTDRVLVKFVERFLLGKKSLYIDDDGNVIKKPGAQYNENGNRALY